MKATGQVSVVRDQLVPPAPIAVSKLPHALHRLGIRILQQACVRGGLPVWRHHLDVLELVGDDVVCAAVRIGACLGVVRALVVCNVYVCIICVFVRYTRAMQGAAGAHTREQTATPYAQASSSRSQGCNDAQNELSTQDSMGLRGILHTHPRVAQCPLELGRGVEGLGDLGPEARRAAKASRRKCW